MIVWERKPLSSRDTMIDEVKAYNSFYNRVIKRCLDLALALFFLIFAVPLYVLISAAILIEDGRPVLYRPLRGGYKGKQFRITKFRTMDVNAEKMGGGTTGLHDPRITKVGNILRKTKLDETANLINILLGSMSFVGPRPELLKYTNQYTEKEQEILLVRPGVTDYSSMEFINLDEIVGSENPDEMYEKLVLKKKNELRIKYAETVSFRTDAFIFFATISKVLGKAISIFDKGK